MKAVAGSRRHEGLRQGRNRNNSVLLTPSAVLTKSFLPTALMPRVSQAVISKLPHRPLTVRAHCAVVARIRRR